MGFKIISFYKIPFNNAPLHEAVLKKNIKIIQILLEFKKIDINIKNDIYNLQFEIKFIKVNL